MDILFIDRDGSKERRLLTTLPNRYLIPVYPEMNYSLYRAAEPSASKFTTRCYQRTVKYYMDDFYGPLESYYELSVYFDHAKQEDQYCRKEWIYVEEWRVSTFRQNKYGTNYIKDLEGEKGHNYLSFNSRPCYDRTWGQNSNGNPETALYLGDTDSWLIIDADVREAYENCSTVEDALAVYRELRKKYPPGEWSTSDEEILQEGD